MGLLTELYNAYNKSLEVGLVDKHTDSKTVLLPLYHNNMRSDGKNIIKIYLNKDSTLENAEFVPDGENIVFPVNENSVARSGSNPPAHPLVDKLDYISPSGSKKHSDFRDTFLDWYDSLDEGKSKEYLKIIYNFITKGDMLMQIVNKIFEGITYTIDGFKLEYEDTSGKKTTIKKMDLTKVFLTYSINEFTEFVNVDVTKNIDLHESYVQYINSNLESNGMCGITGESTYINSKHRGLLGNAKLVSVSNNTETYRGRFKKKADVFSMGYQASEKIHLMLKYLLENENSCRWLGEQQYLINWMSTDISNESEIDVLNPFDILYSDFENKENYKDVNIRNKEIGDSFIKGKVLFSKSTEYYAAIIDKSSNGRLSIKYFRKMPASQLIKNLENWERNNSWETYDSNKKERVEKPPTVNETVLTTFGLERDGRFVLDNGNYKKDLFRKLVTCVIDGMPAPKNYLVNLDINIRKRLSYRRRWNSVLHVACGILNGEKEGTFNIMVDKRNIDRSYLFGRLLALYEIIESRTFEEGSNRVTNAEKFWSSYTNNPENIMQTLEEKIKPYEKRLNISNRGFNIKIQREKQDIITLLDEHTNKKEANKRLTYQFIYGYFSERKFIYTKQEEEIVNA